MESSIESITNGALDFLSNSLKIATGDQPALSIRLSVTFPPSWVRVQGRLTETGGATQLPSTINIAGANIDGGLTASINPDGTFEFPMALPGNYAVRFSPAPVSLTRTIAVGNANPASVEVRLIIPTVRVSGRIVGEDSMRQQGG